MTFLAFRSPVSQNPSDKLAIELFGAALAHVGTRFSLVFSVTLPHTAKARKAVEQQLRYHIRLLRALVIKQALIISVNDPAAVFAHEIRDDFPLFGVLALLPARQEMNAVKVKHGDIIQLSESVSKRGLPRPPSTR